VAPLAQPAARDGAGHKADFYVQMDGLEFQLDYFLFFTK
jgi:hypothetical protein